MSQFLLFSSLAFGALAHPLAELLLRTTSAASGAIPEATAWNPPSGMETALDQVWKQTVKENAGWSDNKDWILDQLMANNGSINYCVRWNTDYTSTEANRTKTASALQRSLEKWVDVLVDFDGFPLTSTEVNVVGYAVKDISLLEGDTSDIDIYTSTDADGVPECNTACYRGAHLNDADYLDTCPGGADSRYDISLWLDDSLEGQMGGFGGNWGQELGPDYLLETVEDENVHILLHEMGHGFGLLDFYDWVPEGQTNFIMMAGSAMQVTEFDAWMLRDWWRKLKAVRNW
ncbi:putative metallopeptidase, catalytic domain superfamily [Septoria linicola]|nr:putative metallopeptidase, catalytic domain superfamily [Septoria linicola]